MDRYEPEQQRTFVACPPASATHRGARAHVLHSATTDSRRRNRAFALLVITAIALVTIPDLITYLRVEHSPILPPGEAAAASDLPIAQLASLGGSAILLALSALVVLMRGHPDRDITGVSILVLAINLPYLLSPELPPAVDIPKLLLANTFVLAIWNLGAPVAGLRWLPITVSVISVYSLIGGLVLPKYMMYNPNSEKALIAGWELAGPFGHANVLGMYCALSLALVPLIAQPRWRLVIGSILFVTVIASASRTALVSTLLIALWWLICCFRSTISVRLAGTFLVTLSATTMFVLPFGDWDPDSFTSRAHVWTEGIRVWEQSPVFGMGVNWFLDTAQASANIAKWAFVGTGHNMVIDTLVKSGLFGLAVLVPLLVAAVTATRALRITSQQIACFGFLMAFFVAATTEAVWALLPNLQLFPISGMVFAVLVMSRRGDRTAGEPL